MYYRIIGYQQYSESIIHFRQPSVRISELLGAITFQPVPHNMDRLSSIESCKQFRPNESHRIRCMLARYRGTSKGYQRLGLNGVNGYISCFAANHRCLYTDRGETSPTRSFSSIRKKKLLAQRNIISIPVFFESRCC